MIDRDYLHPILLRALTAAQHDERWDPHAHVDLPAVATTAIEALERVPTLELLRSMGALLPNAVTSMSPQARDVVLDLIREECQFDSSGPRRPWLLDAARALDPTGETVRYVEQNAFPESEEEEADV